MTHGVKALMNVMCVHENVSGQVFLGELPGLGSSGLCWALSRDLALLAAHRRPGPSGMKAIITRRP